MQKYLILISYFISIYNLQFFKNRIILKFKISIDISFYYIFFFFIKTLNWFLES